MDHGHVRPGGLVRIVVVVVFFIFVLGLKPSLPQELLKLSVAEHGDLLISEGALGTIAVPAEPIVFNHFDIRKVVESLLRVHEKGVGFSVVAKV
jgi:hypothetical protein